MKKILNIRLGSRFSKATIVLMLLLLMLLALPINAFATETSKSAVTVENAITNTGAYLLKTVENPQVGSIGGEWAVLGLARSGYEVPQSWYSAYYQTLVDYVKENKGILHDKKYTEYSRVTLSLTAIGKDPTNISGYNLLEKLGDYDKVIWQGINGPVFALIALDSGDYDIPTCKDAKVQTTRDLLLDTIIKKQLSDGGFALSGTTANADITGMALQALAPYKERADIEKVINKALICLSNIQTSDGGYASYGTANSESVVQVLVALTALGIDPKTDSRFIKNGNNIIDNLLNFYVSGGGFKHITSDTKPNGMATEQAFYGLVAYKRFMNKQNSLYSMSDATALTVEETTNTVGLPNKNADVKVNAVIEANKTFADINGNKAQAEIIALASRGIISGVSATKFEPNRTMTRAEFAAIMVKALGLTQKTSTVFKDVKTTAWYNGYVGSAYNYGIITGKSATVFAPQDTITREEAAVMLVRAAKLCGFDTAMTQAETRDMLAQFSDYVNSLSWSRDALAFCLKQGFISQNQVLLVPKEQVTRAEVAVLVYRMLNGAALLI